MSFARIVFGNAKAWRRVAILRHSLFTLLFVLSLSASAWAEETSSPGDVGAPPLSADAGPPVTAPASVDGGTGAEDAEVAATAVAPTAGAEAAASSNQEIVVTGSRLKHVSSFSPAAPVQVMDRKEIEQTGASNAADLVSYLTVAQGSGYQGAGSQSYGTVSINLRGLGEGATLVLLNGRRLPLSGAYNPKGQQFVDLATIPLAAIERVEILKGGASAIYGTDAVAGVVNIITRKHFDGARLELDGQTTTRFDQRDGTASVALGAESERGRVFLAGSYFSRNELVANQRDWTNGGYVNQEGYPGTFVLGNGKTVVDPACSSVAGSMIVPSASGQICAFSYRNFVSLVPKVERANMFGSGEYDLTKHTTVFGEVLVSQLRGGYISSPAFPIPPPFPTVPANHVDNPFGQNVLAIISPLGAEYGGVEAETDDDTLRGVVGLKGDFEGVAAGSKFESWTWEAYGTAASDRSTFILPDTLRNVIQNDLNSCSDPANLSNCYNPFYSAVTGTGTPNSSALIKSFYGAQTAITDTMLQTVNAGMSGPIFDLPGGEVALAFGGELRHESRATRFDHDSLVNNYSFLIGNVDAAASREVYGGYGEIIWPLVHGLMFQTAGRAEYYTDIQRSAFSPSAGLTFSPADIGGRENAPAAFRRLEFRGQVTSAFRAPNLYQSFPGYVVQPQALNLGQAVPIYLPVKGYGNPNLRPEQALALSGGVTWAPIREVNLAADFWDYDYKDRIELQNAQTIAGQYLANPNAPHPAVAVDPASGQVSEVTTSYINIPGDVVTNGLDFSGFVTLTNKTFGGVAPEERSQKLTLGAVGTYLLTFNYPFSEAAPRTLPDGKVIGPAYCNGTSPTSVCSAAGQRNFNNVWQSMPRWKVNFPVTWNYLGHSVTFVTHYISSYLDDVDPRADGSFDTISASVTFDAQYSYTVKNWLGRELTARIGVYNLADTDPPRVNGLTTSIDYTLADPRGRMVYGKLIAQF